MFDSAAATCDIGARSWPAVPAPVACRTPSEAIGEELSHHAHDQYERTSAPRRKRSIGDPDDVETLGEGQSGRPSTRLSTLQAKRSRRALPQASKLDIDPRYCRVRSVADSR
jgi:hypothetical protein